MNQSQNLIFDQNIQDLEATLESWGEPKYRARQIWNGLYVNLWNTADQFSTLPRSLRQKLATHYSFQSLHPSVVQESVDGETRKTLFMLHDSQPIEAVLMRYEHRRTLCISTQVGCAMGCEFCATGQMGFRRNLSSGEIIEQVLFYARSLAQNDERVTNIVIMGMGEPFHNYDATMRAIDSLNHPEGFNFGSRRFTISTVGLIPAIEKFTSEQRQVNLAISLHAANNELRSTLLPINRRYPIEKLIAACEQYIKSTHRRITFEWALICDINDTPEQAHELAKLLQEFRSDNSVLCHVNVIPLNPTKSYSGQATTHQRALVFQAILQQQGIPCTIRVRRGIDIQAGCGQLAGGSVTS